MLTLNSPSADFYLRNSFKLVATSVDICGASVRQAAAIYPKTFCSSRPFKSQLHKVSIWQPNCFLAYLYEGFCDGLIEVQSGGEPSRVLHCLFHTFEADIMRLQLDVLPMLCVKLQNQHQINEVLSWIAVLLNRWGRGSIWLQHGLYVWLIFRHQYRALK